MITLKLLLNRINLHHQGLVTIRMILHSKYTTLLTLNRQDLNISKQYFKAARKQRESVGCLVLWVVWCCGLFGVCNDGKRQQVNYLIDESQNPGKGKRSQS